MQSINCKNNMSNTTDALPSTLNGINIFWFVFLLLLMICTFCGNILVCLVILRTRNLRTASNYFVVNMALGDLLFSMSSLPMSIIFLVSNRDNPTLFGKRWNIAFDAVWFGFTLLSFINVTIIACERFIAVMRPFYYQTLVSKRRARTCCFCVWIYIASLIFGLVFTFKTPKEKYSFLIPGYIYYSVLYIHVSIALILVPFLYQKIFLVAKNKAVKICGQFQCEKRKNYYLQMKATWTVGLVILLFVLVWLPFLFMQLYEIQDILAGRWDTENSAVTYITYCNGAVNIFVYSFRDTRIRKALAKLFTLKKSVPLHTDGILNPEEHSPQQQDGATCTLNVL